MARILIAHNDPQTLASLKQMAVLLGYNFVAAVSPIDVVAMLSNGSQLDFDLLLLQEIEGEELVLQVKRTFAQQIPIVAFLDVTETKAITKLIEQGATAVLTTPLQLYFFEQAISTALADEQDHGFDWRDLSYDN